MVTWKGLSLTSEVIEAVRGQRPSSEAKKAWRGGFFAKAFFYKVSQRPKDPSQSVDVFKYSLCFSTFSLGGRSTAASSKKVESYSSSYSSASRDGGRPKTEYSTDSTYKSTATGASGIPHTSYAHSSSGYSSENPYKNKVSSYSYNI